MEDKCIGCDGCGGGGNAHKIPLVLLECSGVLPSR